MICARLVNKIVALLMDMMTKVNMAKQHFAIFIIQEMESNIFLTIKKEEKDLHRIISQKEITKELKTKEKAILRKIKKYKFKSKNNRNPMNSNMNSTNSTTIGIDLLDELSVHSLIIDKINKIFFYPLYHKRHIVHRSSLPLQLGWYITPQIMQRATGFEGS